MTRWLWVIVVAVVVAGALEPMVVRRFELPVGIEETRMFYVEGAASVRFVVPAKTRFVELHTAVVIAPLPRYDPASEHPYGIEAVLTGGDERELQRWSVDASARASFDEFPPGPTARRGAKLVGTREWVTDVRVITLPVEALLASTNGELRVTAKAGHRVLVRAFGVRRSRDRLTVVGARGRDYELRRVVLSSYRRPKERSVPDPSAAPIELARGRAAVFNVQGAADLWISAEAACALRVTDGIHQRAGATETPLHVAPGAEVFVALADLGVRSVAIQADSVCRLRFHTERASVAAFIAAEPTDVGGGRIRIRPDHREGSWYGLHPTVPVESLVEAGQRSLSLALRAVASAGAKVGRVEARYELVREEGPPIRREVRVQRPWSDYDSLDGAPVSAAHAVNIRIPAGVRSVRVWGAPTTVLRLAVPTTLTDEVAPPYAEVELPPRRRWYGAPLLAKRNRPILATNDQALHVARRTYSVVYQPRIVGGGRGGTDALGGGGSRRGRRATAAREARREREEEAHWVASPLPADGAPLEERAFMRPDFSSPLAGRAWTRLLPGGAEVDVPSATGGWVTVMVRVPAQALGQGAVLLVDGREVASARLATSTVELRARVDAGRRHVRVAGVPPSAAVFVDAMGDASAHRYVQRRVVPLDRGETVAFRIPAAQDTRAKLVLQVLTPRAGDRWALPYQVFGNDGEGGAARVVESGTARGVATRSRLPILWDQVDGGEAAMGASAVPLRRPDFPTMRTVIFRHAGGTAERVWVRAVLFGKAVPRAVAPAATLRRGAAP